MLLQLLHVVLLFFQQSAAPVPKTAELDYAYFKERVQPIFLKKRPGHARCVVCHDHGTPRLQPLASGASTWNERQSRLNFDAWSQYATPGVPESSTVLTHPLAIKAGGDVFHAGGRHWQSKSDPEWQILQGWVMGKTLGGAQ